MKNMTRENMILALLVAAVVVLRAGAVDFPVRECGASGDDEVRVGKVSMMLMV